MSSSYPGTADTFVNPSGTSTVDVVDHAAQHTNINDSMGAVQTTLGTTAGTSVLKHFAAGHFPIRATGVAAIGTLQQTIVGGTLSTNVVVNPYKARAYRSGSQDNLSDTTWTKVQLNAEEYDTNSNFDIATNYYYTAPVSGFYKINAQVYFSSVVASKNYAISIAKNGLTGGAGVQVAAGYVSAGSDVSQGLIVCSSTMGSLAVNDTLELDAIHYTGAGTTDIAAGVQFTFMDITLIAQS